MKHRFAIGFRRVHRDLKSDIITIIAELLKKEPDNKINLEDNQGSLIVNAIDDQESEVIQSIFLKYDGTENGKVIACIGVYGEDREQDIEEFGVEFLLNVLDAAEEVTE